LTPRQKRGVGKEVIGGHQKNLSPVINGEKNDVSQERTFLGLEKKGLGEHCKSQEVRGRTIALRNKKRCRNKESPLK